MGGNAIQGAERFNKEEYNLLTDLVNNFMISLDFYPEEYKIVRSYRNKESFGDLDIVVSPPPNFFERELENYFTPTEIVKNGNVWSVGTKIYFGDSAQYKIVQLDFIFQDNVELAENYFAWNDLGNLVGRVAHKLGFKYGHEGLKYVFRDGTHQYGEVVVSDDTEDILTFLGYSYSRYKEGFDDLEDIFNFVASSCYFSPEIYLLDNRNNVSRTRDRKRKTYMEFLKWLEGKKFKLPITKDLDKEVIRETHLSWARSIFPNFRDKYNIIQEKHFKDKMLKTWWNGDIAKEVTGLEGKALGKFMQEMKVVYNLEECFDKSLDARKLAKILWNSNFVRNYDV